MYMQTYTFSDDCVTFQLQSYEMTQQKSLNSHRIILPCKNAVTTSLEKHEKLIFKE